MSNNSISRKEVLEDILERGNRVCKDEKTWKGLACRESSKMSDVAIMSVSDEEWQEIKTAHISVL